MAIKKKGVQVLTPAKVRNRYGGGSDARLKRDVKAGKIKLTKRAANMGKSAKKSSGKKSKGGGGGGG